MSVKALTSTVSHFESQSAFPLERVPPGAGYRMITKIAHWEAVERVIRTMHARLDEPLSLQEMADVALLSPYHLNRVFRYITSIPPCKFLAALRIEAAKRLLLTTDMSVGEICFEVGYNSQGTFTTLFTQFVGLSPRRLRRLALEYTMNELDLLYEDDPDPLDQLPGSLGVSGQISATSVSSGPIFIGLFPTPIPQGRPVGCTCLSGPGSFTIAPVPDGRYYIFAVAYDRCRDPLGLLLPDQSRLRVAAMPDMLVVRNGRCRGRADLMLRPTQLIDPPILIALPSLIPQYALVQSVAAA